MWMAMSFEGLMITIIISFSLGAVAAFWLQHKLEKKDGK
jgi:hypothetical protein